MSVAIRLGTVSGEAFYFHVPANAVEHIKEAVLGGTAITISAGTEEWKENSETIFAPASIAYMVIV